MSRPPEPPAFARKNRRARQQARRLLREPVGVTELDRTAPTRERRPTNTQADRARKTKTKRPSLFRAGLRGMFSAVKTTLQKVDKPLIVATFGLCLYGLVMVFSASARQGALDDGNHFVYAGKQLLFMGMGWAALVAVCMAPLKLWRNITWPFAWATLGFLVLTHFVGDTANGSERWLSIAGFRFQPSEIAKLAVVLLVAHGLSPASWNKGGARRWAPAVLPLLLVGAMLGLILKQPNLSITLILGMTTASMLFVGGLNLSWFLVGVPGLGLAVHQLIQRTPYQKERIDGWLNPWQDAQDTGYNLIQSFYAIAFGGVTGSGLGHSVQKLFYLPFQHTDFIFAVLCEEMGLVGAMVLIGLYGCIGYRGYSIAWNASSRFYQLLAFGLTTVILIQAVVNTFVATGLFPVTGVTLPLMSYGGTSVVVTLGLIGLLLRLSREQHEKRLRPIDERPSYNDALLEDE